MKWSQGLVLAGLILVAAVAVGIRYGPDRMDVQSEENIVLHSLLKYAKTDDNKDILIEISPLVFGKGFRQPDVLAMEKYGPGWEIWISDEITKTKVKFVYNTQTKDIQYGHESITTISLGTP